MTAVLARPYWHGLHDIPARWGRSVVALGVFDGLHRGHAHLLSRAANLGERRGLPVVLVTFDPHPASVAGPARDIRPLATLARRATLARSSGADAVLVLPFTRQTADTTPTDFTVDVLVQALQAADVVVGENFRFGHRGAGDVSLLQYLGEQHGFRTHGVPLLPGCSSTHVRRLLSAGDVAGAELLLGRPHQVVGQAEHGNVVIDDQVCLPAPGRYRVRIDDSVQNGVVNESGIQFDGEVEVTVHFLAAVPPTEASGDSAVRGHP